jgi:hypothetical protein
MRSKLLEIAEKITIWHERAFAWTVAKSKTNVWFTALLLFLVLYEIAEHFIIPLMLIWWGLN